jgi:hypothetical protein
VLETVLKVERESERRWRFVKGRAECEGEGGRLAAPAGAAEETDS